MRSCWAAILVVYIAGCSQQTRLVDQIKEADRVVYASNVPGYEAMRTTVTGAEVAKVIKAIGSGRKIKEDITCTPEARLEFYKGSQRITAITNCASAFWINRVAYEDTSRFLDELSMRSRREYDEHRMKSP